MKTAPTNKKVRELISLVKEGKLIPRPEFQRRLVWTREDKNHFLDSILRGYPFPEIYIADGDVDLESGQGTQLLVDGLQRVSTMIQYFQADSELRLTSILPYRELPEEDKKAFLQYDVAVRDLGSVSKQEILEVFQRLNATKYSLLDIEINNAVYTGTLKRFCEILASGEFFRAHNVFSAQDYKRMGDLRYSLSLVGTLLQGYFNRDDAFEDLLSRFNDDFPLAEEVSARVQSVFSFIDECNFDLKSRVWRKADLFTLVVELDQQFFVRKDTLQPSDVVRKLESFYGAIENGRVELGNPAGVYYKAALQASNDKMNRIRRGFIVGEVLRGTPEAVIMAELATQGLA